MINMGNRFYRLVRTQQNLQIFTIDSDKKRKESYPQRI